MLFVPSYPIFATRGVCVFGNFSQVDPLSYFLSMSDGGVNIIQIKGCKGIILIIVLVLIVLLIILSYPISC